MTAAEVAVALVATSVLALAPLAVHRGLQRLRSLVLDRPGSFAEGIALIEVSTLLPALATVLVLPDPPPLYWHAPTLVELGLMVVISPLLFLSGPILGGLASFLGLIEDANDASAEPAAPDSLLTTIPVVLLLVGPAEELLFRGVIQGLLGDAIGPVAAVPVMAVQFSLFHYPNSVDSLSEIDVRAAIQMGMSGWGGLVFGAVYLLTGNLLVVIVAHSLHDAALFASLSLGGDEGADPGEAESRSETAASDPT